MNHTRQKFKALISDVDRTLLDTEQFIFQAYLHTLRKNDLPPISTKYLNSLMGISLEKCYKIIAPQLNTQELANTHRTFQENNLQLSVPFPHSIKTLQELKSAGIKIAAVTSRSKRTSVKTLELAGLMPFLDTVVSMEDIPHNELKPHPRPLLLALDQIKIDSVQAISMGDTKEDIQAGKRAGTKTIGVTYGAIGKRIKESQPNFVVDDILDILPLILN